jgi:pimeloyl-ACP methyl ester carboxylesterase
MASISKGRIAAWVLMVLLLGLVAVYQLRNIETEFLEDIDFEALPGQRVELPGGDTYYELGGPADGRKVVLVHGFTVPSYIWDPTFADLSKAGFRVLRYDLLGRGYSDRPDTDYTPERFAQQLLELTSALGWNEPVHVVGLSMGGLVSATYTDLYKERVRSLSLVDPLTVVHDKPGPLMYPVLGEWLMTAVIVPGVADAQSGDFYDQRFSEGWGERYQFQTRIKGFAQAVLSTVREFADYDIESRYRGVAATAVPVQLFWGKQDQVLPFSDSMLQRAWNPALAFHAIDKAGHLPHYEQNAVVSPLLIDFFNKQ